MNILIACNEKYLDLSRYLLFSLHEHNGNLNIYLIYENLSQTSIDDITNFIKEHQIGSINFIKFDSSTIELPLREGDEITGHITKEAYFRLYAPFYLPEDMERILYLDCDIICAGDISGFYNKEFKDNILVACINTDLGNSLYKERLNLPDDYEYINSGVLLFNLNEYKKYTSIEKLNSFISENAEILDFQDQDVANKMFHEKILHEDIMYNFQIKMLLYSEGGKIIHYTGPVKPWSENYAFPTLAQPYYDTLYKLNELDKLEYMKKSHIANFKQNSKLLTVIINADDVKEAELKEILRQTEYNVEFIIFFKSMSEELRKMYEELDIRMSFIPVAHGEQKSVNITGNCVVSFKIEDFKRMDSNFIRELLYFLNINNLSVVFFINFDLDSNQTIVESEYTFNLEKIHEFIDEKKKENYNSIYRLNLEEENNRYGYWKK